MGESIVSRQIPSRGKINLFNNLLLEQGWSNGRIHSPVHQVIMREKEARYTLGLFSFYRGITKVPEELVDDEHPLLYKPFSTEKLHEFYATKEGQQADDLLKAYCGV